MAQKILPENNKTEDNGPVLSGPRNDLIFDIWSLVHLLTGILLGWIMSPTIAVLVMILWEPLERFALSKFLAKFGIKFGYETVKNSLADIMFDILGISIGAAGLMAFIDPPFHF